MKKYTAEGNTVFRLGVGGKSNQKLLDFDDFYTSEDGAGIVFVTGNATVTLTAGRFVVLPAKTYLDKPETATKPTKKAPSRRKTTADTV